MSNPNSSPPPADLDAWVDAVTTDPVRHRQRQVTHILLHAVARTPELRDALYLKGGILMSAFYGSSRQTGDVDFTAAVPPEPFASEIRDNLDKAMSSAAVDLGYLDLLMRVQKISREPGKTFETAQGSALQMTIGIAEKGTGAAKWFDKGQASEVLGVDISFKEPVINVQVLEVGHTEGTVHAYSLEELIAEKLRALVQQVIRKRQRRQDVYDIAWLIQHVPLDDDARARVLDAFLKKSGARDVAVDRNTFEDPEIKRLAQANWHTMEVEIGTLPDFDEMYALVQEFYRSLPWA
ncbi:nucleotidyl transferase AbiEii/AbiGii toxin family protein [Bosea sp. (in: a-proteobacteria)]|jgi:hypothetical protein|uniref:nucleotidyl transferase AbiEii/AbiGii toxin family protein n=1 Tax=Bosea sp. (in: a-proteobacteria) TaxID=1871050 RepID=UPI0025C2BE25|nr:nucleotidyl transferase AbiEii/AbiGii toxin family protein [Bosea sp. (in: a-proteobacteria)]